MLTDEAVLWERRAHLHQYKTPVMTLENVGKSYGSVSVLRGVDLDILPGQIHAIMGENGAGKSTLVKILSGVIQPSSGHVKMGSKHVHFPTPSAAKDAGITIMHQELSLCPEMTVADNVILGLEPLIGGLIVDKKQVEKKAEAVLSRFGFRIPTNTLIKDLRVGEQQLVEIARALLHDAQILIMDEPTSALSQAEADVLMEVIRDLALRDVAILYISHRMDEVFEISDRITVLRDGNLIGSEMVNETSRQDIIEMMVGRKVEAIGLERSQETQSAPVFEVSGLCLPTESQDGYLLEDINLNVRPGEVVGVAGLLGAGRTELLETIFGARGGNYSGEIRLDGEIIKPCTPTDGMEHGIALITEDRKNTGLLLESSIKDNVALPSLGRWSTLGVPSSVKIDQAAQKAIADLSIKCQGGAHIAGELSGGNQQKVVLGKWLATNPKVLLLDEPTRGVDIGAKDEIYQLVGKLADQGIAILMANSEVPELLAVCDRIVILHEGKITGELERKDFSEDLVKQYSMNFK